MASKRDYLKYWRVIRYWVKAIHGLSQNDIDVLLFLNSEGRFQKVDFERFAKMLPWSTYRFHNLVRDGWIETYGKRYGKNRYQLTMKAERLIISIYNKLEGEEISVTTRKNPMFKKNVSYTDKVYRDMIIEMNKYIKEQQQRPSAE